MADDASHLGPAWEGWETYRTFAESVKTGLRYVRYAAADRFLDEVFAAGDTRKLNVPKGRIFWRARLGCEYEEIERQEGEFIVRWPEERPFSSEGMKPISAWQSEGRANPRGIPYLYLATTRETALAEVRPWIGSKVSVAQFRVARDLDVIDCSRDHSKDKLLALLDKTRTRQDGIWIAIDQAFATPVTKGEETRDYIPTQIIAEMFKRQGFDGIVYKSLLSDDGFNIALFNLNDAELASCALYTATSLKFDFKSEGIE